MSREEGSGATGPQALGRTTFSHRTRVQPESVPESSLPNPVLVWENTQTTRAGVVRAELRDLGKIEADKYMAWKQGGNPFQSAYGVGDGSSVDAHFGSSKENSESNLVHDGAPDDYPNGVEDDPDKFGDAPDSLNNTVDGSNVATDGSNVAANESNDVPDRYHDVLGSSNNAVDGFNDQVTISSVVSFVQGRIDVDERVPEMESPPPSVSEDTNTLTTSLSGP